MTDFEQLANLVTVRDAARPILCQFEGLCSVEDAWEQWQEMCDERQTDPNDELALVATDGAVWGWVGFDSLASGTVGDVADPVRSTQLVAGDTPLADMAEAFAGTDPHFYLVLTGKRITHVLWYDALYCLPFRVCLVVLLLEVERVVTASLAHDPGMSFSLLPEGRRVKAREVYGTRGLRHETDRGELRALVECTTFIDKWTMLRKHKGLFGLLPFSSVAEGQSYFRLAEGVRNAAAHGRSLIEVFENRRDLHHLIQRSKCISQALSGAAVPRANS